MSEADNAIAPVSAKDAGLLVTPTGIESAKNSLNCAISATIEDCGKPLGLVVSDASTSNYANARAIGTAQTAPGTVGVERLRALLEAVDVLLSAGLVEQARTLLRPLLEQRGAVAEVARHNRK